LIQQEKEFTVILKQQGKVHKKLAITKKEKSEGSKYELANLLNDSSSDEEGEDDEEDEDSWENESDDKDGELLIDFDGENNDGQMQQQLMEEEKVSDLEA